MNIKPTNKVNPNNQSKTNFGAIQVKYDFVHAEPVQKVLNIASKNNILRTGLLGQNMHFFITTRFGSKQEKAFLSLLENDTSVTQTSNKIASKAIKDFAQVYPIQKPNKWVG